MWPIKFGSKNPIQELNNINNDINEKLKRVQNKFKNVFEPGFGFFNKGFLKLELKPEAKPKFIQSYKVAFSLRSKVEVELKRLQDH